MNVYLNACGYRKFHALHEAVRAGKPLCSCSGCKAFSLTFARLLLRITKHYFSEVPIIHLWYIWRIGRIQIRWKCRWNSKEDQSDCWKIIWNILMTNQVKPSMIFRIWVSLLFQLILILIFELFNWKILPGDLPPKKSVWTWGKMVVEPLTR